MGITIKDWSSADRPREKLVSKGRLAMTEAELLAILLGTGYKSVSALSLAKDILSKNENSLANLAKLEIEDFLEFKGIGQAKAVGLIAMLELGRRQNKLSPKSLKRVSSSQEVYEHMYPYLKDLNHEEFWAIHLNASNSIIEAQKMSSGGLTGTMADVRMIFNLALKKKATALIVAHNHPSGNNTPSEADKRLTKKLKDAGDILDIPLLDHIIFADSVYFSFADEGLL